MDFYFVAKAKDSGFIGQLPLEEILKRFQSGEFDKNYVVTKSTGPSYAEIIKSENVHWITMAQFAINAKSANPSSIESSKPSSQQPIYIGGTGKISALKFFAWFDLIISIICALIIWFGYSTSTIPSGYFRSENVTNYAAIGLGFGILIQGIFGCVLFLVIASIAENVMIIRRNTSR